MAKSVDRGIAGPAALAGGSGAMRVMGGDAAGDGQGPGPGGGVLAVRGGSQEQRRVILARLPHPLTEPAARLADALRAAATDLPAPR